MGSRGRPGNREGGGAHGRTADVAPRCSRGVRPRGSGRDPAIKMAAPRGAKPSRGGRAGLFLLFDLLGGGVERGDLGVAELAVVVLVEGLEGFVGGGRELLADGFDFGAIDFAVGVGVEFLEEGGVGLGIGGGFLAVALGGVGRGREEKGGDGEGEEETFHGWIWVVGPAV